MSLLLAKLVLEIRYDAEPTPMRGSSDLLARAFADELRGQDPLPEFPFQVSHRISFKRDQVGLAIDKGRMIVEARWPANDARAAALVVAYMDKAQRAFGFDALARVGLRSFWVEARSTTFEQLVDRLKAAWLSGASQLVRDSADVAMSLTLKHREHLVNFSAGPVEPNELGRWAIPANEQAVGPMLFVDIDYPFVGNLEYRPLVRVEVVREVLEYARGLAELAARETRQ